MTENSQPLPVAGWYPDPVDETKIRYWDGQKWTEQVAERAAQDSSSKQSWSGDKNEPNVVQPALTGQQMTKAVFYFAGFGAMAFVAIAMLLLTS